MYIRINRFIMLFCAEIVLKISKIKVGGWSLIVYEWNLIILFSYINIIPVTFFNSSRKLKGHSQTKVSLGD